MKNLNYALLAINLFAYSYTRGEGIIQPAEMPTVPTTPCFQCPNGTEYGSLAEAKKACGDQAAEGTKPIACPNGMCRCMSKNSN